MFIHLVWWDIDGNFNLTLFQLCTQTFSISMEASVMQWIFYSGFIPIDQGANFYLSRWQVHSINKPCEVQMHLLLSLIITVTKFLSHCNIYCIFNTTNLWRDFYLRLIHSIIPSNGIYTFWMMSKFCFLNSLLFAVTFYFYSWWWYFSYIWYTGLSMSLVKTADDGSQQMFTFEHNHHYQEIQFKFYDAVESLNTNTIAVCISLCVYICLFD